MPKASPIQNAFNAGELSPLMYGRTDVEKYKSALRTCLNTIPLVQGGATRRPGTRFVNQTKHSGSKQARLQRFEYSVTQAYILEFGDLYCRFFKDDAIITNTAQNITGATKANPVVITYSGADTYANGDKVIIANVVGMTQLNNREFTVANVNTGANTFELSGVNGLSYDTYVSGGTVAEPYEVTTTYAEADIPYLKFAQSADTLYITHPSYPPKKLTRTGHTSWTLSSITFLDGPFLSTNSTSTTLALSGTTGSVTVTASATTGINGGSGFASTDIGRLIRWKDPANNWTWLTITAFTDTTHVTATISGPNASAGTATANWRLGVWSATTGYPAAVCFYQDRLFFAGPTSYPQRIDGSNTGDYENFAPTAVNGTTVSDSNAIAFTLNANDVNVIRWLAANERGLTVGTVGGEWLVKAADGSSTALSPTNVGATQHSAYGSANVAPIQAGKASLFLNRSKRKLRELAYVYEIDGFKAPDMTVLSEHVTRGGVTELAYAQNPQSIIWAVRADGTLLGLTYEREQNVVAWHRHELGGEYSGGNAVVESVACIPAADGLRDETWLIVKRTIQGSTERYVEVMTKIWEHGDVQEDAVYYDCGITYDGAPTASLSGAFYLEGQTVGVLTDGAAHPDVTITSGKIALNWEASVVQWGLKYNSDAGMLRIEAGAADGTAQGKNQRVHRVIFRMCDSLGLSAGPDFDNLDAITFRTSNDSTNSAVPLYSGDKEKTWDGGYRTDDADKNSICWRWAGGWPGTMLAVMPQLNTQDR